MDYNIKSDIRAEITADQLRRLFDVLETETVPYDLHVSRREAKGGKCIDIRCAVNSTKQFEDLLNEITK